MERVAILKESYYKNMVEDLKVSNVGQWYSKVKRMSSIDPTSDEKVIRTVGTIKCGTGRSYC